MSGEIDKANQRAFVAKMYSGPRWKRQVKNMTDAQVFAIWKRATSKPKAAPKHKESGQDEAPF